MCSGQFDIEICQFSQRRVFQLYLVFWSWRNISFVGSTPLDPSLTQTLEDGQAFIALFPNSPTLKTVNIITSKLLQMESNGNQLLKKNGCRVCGNYKAGQMWLRWQNDQLLVSPYSASLLLIKPVMRIAAIINWKTSSCQQILRTVMSREMKDSEGELTVWTRYWK